MRAAATLPLSVKQPVTQPVKQPVKQPRLPTQDWNDLARRYFRVTLPVNIAWQKRPVGPGRTPLVAIHPVLT